MIHFKKILKVFLSILLLFVVAFFLLSRKTIPEHITYGVSFSKFHSDELGLSWKDVFISTLDDLKVRNFRLSAHWPMIEPKQGEYHFDELDFQMQEAKKRDAHVVLAVGRRLPGWPECHDPDWIKGRSVADRNAEVLSYIEAVVKRYRDYPNITYWQVENEPYLSVFAHEQCGDLDPSFLKQEVALVKNLDPDRKILVTDSGNLGTWYGAWRTGDVFGTSIYLYLWNPTIGQVKTVYSPAVYRAKSNFLGLIAGQKKNILIELSLEPWLLEPIVKAPLQTQLERMDIHKFKETISFAKTTGFDVQYLWGVEWWYFMKKQNHSEYWDEAKRLFSQ